MNLPQKYMFFFNLPAVVFFQRLYRVCRSVAQAVVRTGTTPVHDGRVCVKLVYSVLSVT